MRVSGLVKLDSLGIPMQHIRKPILTSPFYNGVTMKKKYIKKYDNTPHSFSMDETLFQDFKRSCNDNGFNVSQVLRELIQEHMLEQLRLAHVNGEAMAEEV